MNVEVYERKGDTGLKANLKLCCKGLRNRLEEGRGKAYAVSQDKGKAEVGIIMICPECKDDVF